MSGFQLEQPVIKFRDIANVKSGAISNRGQLYKPHLFQNWIFAYSNVNQQDLSEAISVENYLRQASEAYGIKFKQPKYVEVSSQARLTPYQFCDAIKKQVASST